MRLSFVIALGVASALVFGCNGEKIVDNCPTGARSGSAPTCILTTQCSGTHVGAELDCSGGNNQCVCYENGVVGKTVDYKDDFCSAGDSTNYSSLESALEAANDACGWNL